MVSIEYMVIPFMCALKEKHILADTPPFSGQTKLRAAYSRPPQVAIGGLIAGAAAFLSPLILYLVGSAIANSMSTSKGPDFEGRMAWLIDYFGIRVIKGIGIEHSHSEFYCSYRRLQRYRPIQRVYL